MHVVYPARYEDRLGEEFTSIGNDGKTLSMVVRAVEFQGTDWDSFEPNAPSAPGVSAFTLQQGSLCACKIEAEIPIPLVMADKTDAGILEVHLELGEPLPNGCLDRQSLKLRLRF